MKNIISITILLISYNCLPQSNVSDILNKFKLGSKYEKTSDLKERFSENEIISCQYIGNDQFDINGVPVTSIKLMFYKNQLMIIEVNIGNPFIKDNFDENEFTIVSEQINKETGAKSIVKSSASPEILKEINWKKESVNYNLKRLKYKFEGSDSILGLLLLSDVNISENFMTNMKK